MGTWTRHASVNARLSLLSGAARRKPPAVVRQLTPDQWSELRDIRLTALADSPQMFLSTFDREKGYLRPKWENEFKRGDWYAGYAGDRPICMVGVTKEADTPPYECFIEYMWVAPQYRGSGVARSLLEEVLSDLRETGYKTVFLWILDGNNIAAHLYERLGFDWTGRVQQLTDRPGRTEHQMSLNLKRASGLPNPFSWPERGRRRTQP
jgi:ribosomal protein S18 acetylase RimI-like enzyme